MTLKCHICRYLLLVASVTGGLLGSSTPAAAQRPKHPLYHSDLPPGALGAMQVGAGRARSGYVQPVQIKLPEGATASIADGGGFQHESTDLRVGLTVGQPYRLRISGIPQHEAHQLYPSVELIDHLHPPDGQRDRFPIPIELTQEDLETALRGSLVVRVVYVENPQRAFPEPERGEQLTTDVLPSEDPLHVADDLGRPVAVVRLGSRTPLTGEIDAGFTFGEPPVELLASLPSQPLQNEVWEQEPAPIMMKTPLSTRGSKLVETRDAPPVRPAPVITPPVTPSESPFDEPAADVDDSDPFAGPSDLPSDNTEGTIPEDEPVDDEFGAFADTPDTNEPDATVQPEAEADIDPFDIGDEPTDDPFQDDAS
ncbi:MAG: hypothetical protein KDA92_17405 [Planctomycetales bacterium]|nr:hypothetical protein [Planctomycetales bacterium]